MARPPFRFLLTTLFIIIIVVGLILIYNYFLLDNSIERIRTSLKQVSKTKSFTESEGMGFLLQDLFMNELTDSQINLQRLVASEAFESAFQPERFEKSRPEIKFLLQDLLSSHEKGRLPALLVFDRIMQFSSHYLESGFESAQFLIKRFNGTAHEQEILEESALSVLAQARELELKWKFADAALLYERFLKNFPSYQDSRFVEINLAAVYLRAGRFDDAKRLIKKISIASAAPNEVRLVELLHAKMEEMQKLISERDRLESDAKKGPSEFESGTKDGSVASRLKQLENKQKEWKPEIIFFRLGIINLRLFDLEKARQAFETVLNSQPSLDIEKRTKWALGWIHLLETNYQESKRLMSELLQKFPEDEYGEMGSFTLAAISGRSGDFEDAVRRLKLLSSKTKSQEAEFLLKYKTGNIYLYDLQDLSNALTQFEDAKKIAPTAFLSEIFAQTLPSIYANSREMAFSELLEGNIKTAKKLFEDILAVNPDDAWSRCGYGVALYLNGEKEEGLKNTITCRNVQKDAFTNSALAFLNAQEGKNEDAILLYRDAVSESKEYLPALYNLGCLEMRAQEWEKAAEHLLSAKKQAERTGRYQSAYPNNLGVAYAKLGRVENAKVEFLTALEWNPKFSDAATNLSQLKNKKPELVKSVNRPQTSGT